MSLMNELMYSSYQTKGSFRSGTSPTRYEEETFTFEYSYIKLNTMFRYGFLFGNSSIFINGGISNGLVLNEVNTSFMFRKVETYESSSTRVGHNSTRKHELGFLGGVGFKRNRASIEMRTERGGGPFRDTNSKAHVNRYYALFGYRIK